jgi:steroid delta-isomerase-like uncharacterized protein
MAMTSMGAVMATNVNKDLARRIVEEMWNTRNLEVIDACYAPSQDGHEATKAFIASYWTAFPDLHITIDDQIAEGNQVATRYTARGTHLGHFAGIPPTGEQMTTTAIETHLFADGKLVELWNSFDPLGMLQRVGAIANRAIVRRWYDDYVNGHDVDVLDDLVTLDFTSHFLSGAEGACADQIKQIDGAIFTTLPDLRVTIQDMVVEGDRVAVRYSTLATLASNPPGVPLAATGMDIFRIADGKIAQRWAELDYTGMLMQLGAVPHESVPIGEQT